MSEEQRPDDQNAEIVKGDPVRFPDAHEGAPRDPKLLGGELMGLFEGLKQTTEPQDVTEARVHLAALLDPKGRKETVSEEELAEARKALADALERAGTAEPPVD